MCCFVAVLFSLGPRAAILVWWLVDQLRWNAAFDSFIWPFLGFLVLPWTTLMYVVVFPGGIEGFDYVWMAQQRLLDLGRGDLLPSPINDVLDAPNNEEVSVLVQISKITGSEPAVPKRGRGSGGIIVVSSRDGGTPQRNLSAFA